MKNLRFTIIILLLIFSVFSFGKNITKENAERVAKNYYFDHSDKLKEQISFAELIIKGNEAENYYYIFNLTGNNGFVIVSAEDAYYPVIGYSNTGNFVNENQPENLKYWMENYINQIKYLRDNKINADNEIQLLWKKYNVPVNSFVKSGKNTKTVDPLTSDILWDQGTGWNDLCPEDGAGPGGHVWAGCVATAMGIIMKYWNYPIHGVGSHSYYAAGYGTQSVNYADATYFWNNMENGSPNMFSAYLLYHLGVSVDMMYGPNGSGAYSMDVDNALENYFDYSSSAQYVSRNSYSDYQWINNILKPQLDADKPVYYSGNDGEGGHAFVFDGYDAGDNFHINFGWSGSSNGWYTIYDAGGFCYGNAAVINIEPAGSNTYPEAPSSLTTVIDPVNDNQFNVDITWEAPLTKDVATYLIYRDFEQISEVPASSCSYTDINPDPANYHYSVAAKYTNTEESLTVSDYFQGMFSVTFHAIDPNTSNEIFTADVTFNEEVKPTTFVGATFSNVPYGGQKLYSISHDDYPTTSGTVNVSQNMSVDVLMDGSQANVENFNDKLFAVYPNPSKDKIYVSYPDYNGLVNFEFIDISGKIIYSGEIVSELTEINIESFKEGFYILKLYSDQKIFTKSIIIR